MRNQTSEQLALFINVNKHCLEDVYDDLCAYDVTEGQFFFVHKGQVVQAYTYDDVWYCKF